MPDHILVLVAEDEESVRMVIVDALITSALPRPDQSNLPEKCRFLTKLYRHHILELAGAT
jgi:hypothetical protein